MTALELLAPARNIDIGIAAIDCGADAVYIAASEFGARKDAGNSLEDVRRLCEYAHRFGCRIFLTVNTILYDDELSRARALMLEAQEAGVDAFIVQDAAALLTEGITVPIHASTQCAIRTPEDARFYESLGCGRIVLERELSLEQIRQIRAAVDCEIETFVHGALCVCYSGNCYMSEAIDGRSANRGGCIQACRSLYDLVDDSGKVLMHDKALLSLKDLNLIERLSELAEAGVCSFKIEGRLKNLSYVKNVTRAYSMALDALVSAHPEEYCRASFGRVSDSFTPNLDKTFNRGYTELFFDGRRGKWSSMDAPKSMGEEIGTVSWTRMLDRANMQTCIKPVPGKESLSLHNGDGFSVIGRKGIIGFRGDVCEGNLIQSKPVPEIGKGMRVYRNLDADFEKTLERCECRREIGVTLNLSIRDGYSIYINAVSEDGREVFSPFKADLDTAENRERQMGLITGQLSKRSGHYSFRVGVIDVQTKVGKLPLLSAAILNSIRRLIAEDLDRLPCRSLPLMSGKRGTPAFQGPADYKRNISNRVSDELYNSLGAKTEEAFELSHRESAELMRSKYCIRYELGMCPIHQGAPESGPLHLLNNGRSFLLGFECKKCEMTVKEERPSGKRRS